MVFILAGGLILSFLVGILTGIFGVGGGFLLTPGLIILLHVPSSMAVGTSLTIVLINSLFGLVKRRGSGTVDVKLALTIASGSIVGTLLGARALNVLKHLPPLTIRGHAVVTITFILLWAFLLVFVWIAWFMYADYRKTGGQPPAKRIGLFAKITIPPYTQFVSLEEPQLAILPLLLLGGVTGFLTGLMGIGGGVALLPALIYLVGQRAVKAAGTSLLLTCIAASVSCINNLFERNIDWGLFAVMMVGGLAGANVGAKIGLRIKGPKLRLYFIYVLFAAILLVAYELVHIIFLNT